MEVVQKSPRLLCNYEVWSILKEIKEGKNLKYQKSLATVTYEAIKYLEDTSCIYQKRESIQDFLTQIKDKELNLTKAEKLQMINNRPNNLIELQLLIEENEERFSEDALNLILDIIKKTLPGDPEKELEESDDEAMDDSNGEENNQ